MAIFVRLVVNSNTFQSMANKHITAFLIFPILAFSLCSCKSTAGKAAAGGGQTETGETAAAPRQGQPVQYTYNVRAVYPHDTGSYTQGLYWHDGLLWEGAGQYGESALKKVDLESGKALDEVSLPRNIFGEGIALLDGVIYQLTWMNGLVYTYDAATMRRTGSIDYGNEAWGLTTDGRRLYLSDGSHEIHVIDPDGFRRERSFPVRMGRNVRREINELEWIGGRIWANVYMEDHILIINPENGQIEGVVDLGGLLPEADRTGRTDVLNGIAYDEAGDRIFVTGKYWPKLFEIELVEKK